MGIFHELLVRPLYNILIFLVDVGPDSYLAFAIIVLTLLIRLALLGPAGSAIKSQREMQRVAPELEKIKKKYVGNQQKISEETMALFKKHKVNPLGGCLPLLIQLPILWAFYWVINSIGAGSEPALYSFVPAPVAWNTLFFWIPDITKPDVLWLPILVAVFQFLQMKTISWQTKKRQEKAGGEIVAQQQMVNHVMTYAMPVMIGFIARSLSAGLSLYWITTSVFGIGQQFYIAWSEERSKTKIN